MTTRLPTIDEMFTQAWHCLDRAGRDLSDARDGLNCDWRPRGAPLTKTQADARNEAFRLIREAKVLIGQAKTAVNRAR